MAMETWGKDPYGAIWLSLIMLFITLIFGVRGYNGKTNFWWGATYTATIIILSGFNAVILGQYMYDETAKYNVLGNIGATIGMSIPMIFSGLILLVFYRYRVVSHSKEIVIKDGDAEVTGSDMLSGMLVILWLGIMMFGIGMRNVASQMIGDGTGIFYVLLSFIPIIISFWLIAKYRKWTFKYIVWVLRRKGLLQEIKEEHKRRKNHGIFNGHFRDGSNCCNGILFKRSGR